MSFITRGIVLAAVGLFLSAMLTAPFMPLFDPDEAYYPATAAESVDAGAGWDPRLNGERRWDKPVLAYALIETSFAALGRSVTAARVPSALQGAALVLIVGLLVARIAGPGPATLAATVLATTIGVQIFSRVAHPEIGVVLAITTIDLLFVLWLVAPPGSRSRWIAAAAGGAAGYGILAKGPVAVALPVLMAVTAMPFVARRMRVRTVRSIAGDAAIAASVALLVAAPWYIAMSLRHGSGFLYEALWLHNVARYSGAAFEHREPFWFYVVPTFVAVLPWSACLPAAFAAVWRRDDTPKGVLQLCMAAALSTGFIFYSVSASKLPHYVVVLVAPIAVLTGLHLDALRANSSNARSAMRIIATVLGAVAVVLAAIPLIVGRLYSARELIGGAPGRDPAIARLVGDAAWPTACLLLAGAIAVATLRPRARLPAIVAVGAIMPALLIASAMPLLRVAYPWERLGRQIADSDRPVWLVGPRAPSLTFFVSRPVRRIAVDDAARELPCGADGWIIAEIRWLTGPQPREICPHMALDIVDESGTMALARVRSYADLGGQHP